MKIEYLLIKPNNDFCSSVEQFKSLLCSNKRILFSDNEIKFSNSTLSYSLTSDDVTWKKNKEVVFYFTAEATDAETLESFDSLLHRINDNCGRQFTINTIWDDVSIYYTNRLYPEMVRVENLLRKLIYRFMIKTAGSAWFGDTTPDAVKEAIKNTAGKNRLEELPSEDQLYLADFIQLGLFFFEKYTTKPFGQDVIKRLKEVSSTEDAGESLKAEIASIIETYEAKSNWDRYFADKIEVDDLYEKWKRLYGYRNCAAHAKRVKKADYDEATKLIEELKTAFTSCLEHINTVKMTEEEAEAVQEVAKETMAPYPSKRTYPGKNLYPGMVSALETLGLAAKSAMPPDGVASIAQTLTSLPQNFPDNSLLVASQLASTFQSPAFEAARNMQRTMDLYEAAFEPMCQVTEAIYRATEPQRRLKEAMDQAMEPQRRLEEAIEQMSEPERKLEEALNQTLDDEPVDGTIENTAEERFNDTPKAASDDADNEDNNKESTDA